MTKPVNIEAALSTAILTILPKLTKNPRDLYLLPSGKIVTSQCSYISDRSEYLGRYTNSVTIEDLCEDIAHAWFDMQENPPPPSRMHVVPRGVASRTNRLVAM